MTQTVPDTSSCLKETSKFVSEENSFFGTSIDKKQLTMSGAHCPPALISPSFPPYQLPENSTMKSAKKSTENRSCFSDWTTENFSEQENLKRHYDAIVPENKCAYTDESLVQVKTESPEPESFHFETKRKSSTSDESHQISPSNQCTSFFEAPRCCNPNGFFEENSFQKEKQKFTPTDPFTWQPSHVMAWLNWMVEEYGLSHFDVRNFSQIDGETLCSMSVTDFSQYMPHYNGEVFAHQLQLLRQASSLRPNTFERFRSSPESVSQDYHSSWGESEIEEVKTPLEDIYKLLAPVCTRLCKQGGGQIQLWQFLMELLGDHSNSTCIAWESTNGEFKMVDPDEVARRWGERKSKPNMNYDKMSRALRYYYDKNIMTKVHGKRYAYKFDFHGLAQSLQSGAEQDKVEGASNQSHYLPTYNESLQQGYFSYPNPAGYPFMSSTSRLSESSDSTFPSLSYGNHFGAGHQQSEFSNRHSWSDSSSVASGHYGYDPPASDFYKTNSFQDQSYAGYVNYRNEIPDLLGPSSGRCWNQNISNWCQSDNVTCTSVNSPATNYSYYDSHATHSTSSIKSSSGISRHHQSEIYVQENIFFDGVQRRGETGIIY